MFRKDLYTCLARESKEGMPAAQAMLRSFVLSHMKQSHYLIESNPNLILHSNQTFFTSSKQFPKILTQHRSLRRHVKDSVWIRKTN